MKMSKRFGSSGSIHIVLIFLALAVRIIAFPHLDETRNVDETGYLQGSLAILEGLPAGYKAAPAGPNLWVGWAYTGGVAAWNVLHPGPEEKAVPLEVRPFVAVNHALFDQYQNLIPLHVLWIVTQLFLAVWATSAAFRFGLMRGGLAGGILIGGFFAVLPLYVDFTLMSRPYMTAWSLAMLSLHAAACRTDSKRVLFSGIFLGLATASRVEMLAFTPIVFWEFWFRRAPGQLSIVAFRLITITLITSLLAAPWLVTHLIGNLRTIATVRFGPNPQGPTTMTGLILELAWAQGLFGALAGYLLVLIALIFPDKQNANEDRNNRQVGKIQMGILAAYVALLLASLSHGTIYLQQQGSVVLAVITISAFAAALINRRFPSIAPWIAVAVLLIPLYQTFQTIRAWRQQYVPNPSVKWVEAHVPPETRLYFQTDLRNPLPTEKASNALWDEVTNDTAGQRKFASGLERFGLSARQIPKALSDENLVQERGNRRGMFILGSRLGLPDPRFDIQLFNSSPVFGIQDLPAAFKASGGVVVWHGFAPPASLGAPVTQWANSQGFGTYIFCSPDVRAKLKNP